MYLINKEAKSRHKKYIYDGIYCPQIEENSEKNVNILGKIQIPMKETDYEIKANLKSEG